MTPAKDSTDTILCIEDDQETASLIAEELVERGFRVIVTRNGRDGINAILEHRPDLVLCDINMPKMSGFEVLDELTNRYPQLGDIPFIFLTAMADRDSELKGRRLGADDYITKPIDFDVLGMTIAARLARVARTQVWARKVDLSSRETEVLAWSARGKSSLEIAQILGLAKRTVDFHIDTARRKLGVATRIEAAVKAASGRLIDP